VYKPEIDEVLTRHLGRVEAPKELWDRIENSQVSARVPTRSARVRALIAVAVMMVIVGIVVRKNSMTPRVSKTPEALTSTCQLCHAGA
jgi:hypothetical protein